MAKESIEDLFQKARDLNPVWSAVEEKIVGIQDLLDQEVPKDSKEYRMMNRHLSRLLGELGRARENSRKMWRKTDLIVFGSRDMNKGGIPGGRVFTIPVTCEQFTLGRHREEAEVRAREHGLDGDLLVYDETEIPQLARARRTVRAVEGCSWSLSVVLARNASGNSDALVVEGASAEKWAVSMAADMGYEPPYIVTDPDLLMGFLSEEYPLFEAEECLMPDDSGMAP